LISIYISSIAQGPGDVQKMRGRQGKWKMEGRIWKGEDGRGRSLQGFPSGHKGPEHGTDLFVTDDEHFVLIGLNITAVEGKIQPKLGFFRFAKGIVEAILKDGFIAPFGEALNDVATHGAR
jgi:hypothetical protein